LFQDRLLLIQTRPASHASSAAHTPAWLAVNTARRRITYAVDKACHVTLTSKQAGYLFTLAASSRLAAIGLLCTGVAFFN
jgi:hypothetical protein